MAMQKPVAANAPYRLPPPLFSARCRACWFVVGLVLLMLGKWTALMHAPAFAPLVAAPLARYTTMRVGGAADVLVTTSHTNAPG